MSDHQDLSGPAWPFWLLMALFLVAMFVTGYLASPYSNKVGYLFMPVTAFFMALENGTLAASIAVEPERPEALLQIRFAVASFIAPMLIITQFELNYEVHKARSANFFCCITFDQGHRKKYGFASQVSRYSIWVTALFLAIVSIIASATHISDVDRFTETYRFTNKKLQIPGSGDRQDDVTFSSVMDFVVPLILFAKSFYTGISFWRYGTSISTDVRATIFNPWASLTVAASLYLVALLVTPSSMDAPFLVNTAEFLLHFALMISAYLGDQNFKMLKEWDSHFIRSLGDYFIPEHPKTPSIVEGPTHLRYQPGGDSSAQLPVPGTEQVSDGTGRARSYTPFSTARRPTVFEHPTSMPIAPRRSSALTPKPQTEELVSPQNNASRRERLQEQTPNSQRSYVGPRKARPPSPRRPRGVPRTHRPRLVEQHEDGSDEETGRQDSAV
eukprot:gb/GECG01004579.1/.p1 GENE.gb/GECG01004579.1/~~gb/GECG01004579.1/.p1  ORF type:complete len:443 (+),score=23.90 gb/GECG01004579.1/:1-1329(+)